MAMAQDVPPLPVSLEDHPITRPEYLSVMVHFYRAEVSRSTSWRQRLDATTNWAVLTSAGMLSFAFATPAHAHVLLLLSNLIILAYLIIEARRYRYFEIYRARVRMLEENFIRPIVTRELDSPMTHWRQDVAADLDRPKYKTTLMQSIGFRLRRNYGFIFLILLGGWMVKLWIHPTVADSFAEVWSRAGVGQVGSWVIVSLVSGFYLMLLVIFWRGMRIHGNVGPSDEVVGVEQSLEDWKL